MKSAIGPSLRSRRSSTLPKLSAGLALAMTLLLMRSNGAATWLGLGLGVRVRVRVRVRVLARVLARVRVGVRLTWVQRRSAWTSMKGASPCTWLGC